MAKKELKVRNIHAINRSNSELPDEYPSMTTEIKSDPRVDFINAGISQYSPDNIPKDWDALKKEIIFLETVSIKSDIILGHRLNYVRDNELFKKDGYESMVNWVEETLNISKTKAYFLMSVVDIFPFRHGGIKKVKNLEIAMPIIRNHLEKKDEIFDMAQKMGRKDFLAYLKVYKTGSLSKEELLEEVDDSYIWYPSEEELINNSKFVRAGMKAKTVKAILKDMTNWFLIHEPKNNKVKKMIDILKEL